MGHPGLLSAQPDRRAMLLQGEDRQWYHSHMHNENSETRGEGVPPAPLQQTAHLHCGDHARKSQRQDLQSSGLDDLGL